MQQWYGANPLQAWSFQSIEAVRFASALKLQTFVCRHVQLRVDNDARGSTRDALVLSEVSRLAHAQMGVIATTTGVGGTARKASCTPELCWAG